MVEKRIESRTNISWQLLSATIDANGEGRTINASLSGFLFQTNLELPIGGLVLLRVQLDPSTNINCVAKIVRQDTCATEHRYGAEIQFISATDRQKLSFALLTQGKAA